MTEKKVRQVVVIAKVDKLLDDINEVSKDLDKQKELRKYKRNNLK